VTPPKGAKPFRHRRERRPLRERLEEKIDRSGGPDACHPWTGARRCHPTHKYGLIRVKVNGENMCYRRAHKIAYELKYGPVGPGIRVLHTCDNPPCCNERHLFAGTQRVNLADMRAKGRGAKPPPGARGTKSGTSRKTP